MQAGRLGFFRRYEVKGKKVRGTRYGMLPYREGVPGDHWRKIEGRTDECLYKVSIRTV
jgi:hypothetical protein